MYFLVWLIGFLLAHACRMSIPMRVSVYLCIRPQFQNASSRICHDGFSWYLNTMIIWWEDNRKCSGIWGQRSSRGHWGHCSNTLETLCLYNLIDFDETWVKRSLVSSSFGLFRNFWSEVILESFGVTVERSNFKQPSTTKLTMVVCWSMSIIERCSWWPFFRPVV